MRKLSVIGRVVIVGAVAAAAAFGVSSATAKPVGGGGGGCICTDNYAPVICSNGVVYSNACRASCAKATGCVPYGAN